MSRYSHHGERGSPEHIVEAIKRLNSDIVFLPEAFDGSKKVESDILYRLEELNYSFVAVPYNEHSDRQFQAVVDPHMLFLSKLEVVRHQECRPGDIRNMIVADVIDPASHQVVRFFGVHLDDRNEENRLCQLDDLVPLITASEFPAVVMGDFNAMYSSSMIARFLRNQLTRNVLDLLPHHQIKDVLRRLSQMAIGDTLQKLEGMTDLVGADAEKRPTTTPKMRGLEWMPSIRLAQIDHIFVSPDIKVGNLSIAKDGGSDHRAISAVITTTGQKS